MIRSLFGKKANAAHVMAVYNVIVAQSRQQIFYAVWDVPDTLNGRFDMISLHLCVLFRRLKTGDESNRIFSQALFDLFFLEMDRTLREMGAGDMAIPKRIQQMGELFYGMLEKLTTALDEDDSDAVTATISRNIYDGKHPNALGHLANYVLNLDADLNSLDARAISAGKLEMRAPA